MEVSHHLFLLASGLPKVDTLAGRTVSVTSLLQSPEQLFQRLVSLSGTCLLRRPVPLSAHEQFYQNFCIAQGLTAVSGTARIKAMDKLSSHELLLKCPASVPFLPTLDHDVLHMPISFVHAKNWPDTEHPALPGLVWCKSILIGDCAFDVSFTCARSHGKCVLTCESIGQHLRTRAQWTRNEDRATAVRLT